MRTLSCRVATVAIGALLLAGCSDNPTRPSPVDTLDVAALLTEMSPVGRIDGSLWTVPSAVPGFMVAPKMDPAHCTYSSTSDFFVCPDTAANGMRFTRMYRLIDGAGNSQSKPDANTSAIETRTTVAGTDSTVGALGPGVRSTMRVAGRSDMTLSGIRTDKQMLNGIATTTLDIRNDYGDAVRQVEGNITETATELALPNPKAGRIWPSGTFTIVQPPGMDIENTTLIQTTFDGNGHMTVKTTTASGTTTCRVNMGGESSPDDGCTSSTP